MDHVILGIKHTHVSYTTHANRAVRRAKLTAARMDFFVAHRRLLSRNGFVYQSHICAHLGFTRATICIMLRRMEKHGFVQRRRSDVDRRQVVVEITPAGFAAFDKVSHLVDKHVYREIVDWNLQVLDFKEPLPEKRARFIRYIDALRTYFGDITQPLYPLEVAPSFAIFDHSSKTCDQPA